MAKLPDSIQNLVARHGPSLHEEPEGGWKPVGEVDRLTFSIANGLAFGFTAHTLIRVLAGRGRQVNWVVYGLTGLFLLRFFYLGQG